MNNSIAMVAGRAWGLLMISAAIAVGAIRHVPGEAASIQAAIDAAQAGDTIIVAPNIYHENLNFRGKAVTLTSSDPNDPNLVAATVIDGSLPTDPNKGSVVTFNSGEGNNSVLTGFTITGGTGSWVKVYWRFKGYLWNRCGGGVLCTSGSSPTVTRNVFRANRTGEGGGLYCYDHSNPIVTDNLFTNNIATVNHGFASPDPADPNNNDHGDGGAMVAFQYCNPIISRNIISANTAYAYGGGIHMRQWSNGSLTDNQVMGNHSMLGAGIHITYTSSPWVAYNNIQHNTTSGGGGGGIYIYYGSNPLVERNYIAHNTDMQGAGIAIYWDSGPRIRNNLIVANQGVAVHCGSTGTPLITHNTIAYNQAASAFGALDCWSEASPVVEHNIIASNSGVFGIYAYTGTSPVIRFNNIWGNTRGGYGGYLSDQTGISGNIAASPSFVDPNHDDYHLLPHSPGINSGDPAFSSLGQLDYYGFPRRMGQFVDIGAAEYKPLPPADLNCDGVVDLYDFQILSQDWLAAGDRAGDINLDSSVDPLDLGLLAQEWLGE